MRPFSLLVKPASADCNLACSYCFYLRKQALYPHSPMHRMSDATLECMIRSYMPVQPAHAVFGWQGGEPLLMGLPFFERVTELQQRHGRSGQTVSNGLQTNGTLITDALAAHFAKYRFLLGVSLDGPPALHDHYRRNTAGHPSHAAVRRGIECLMRHQVEFNILVLVSQANVRHAREVYRYLCDSGFRYQQYIPCVEFDAAGALQPFAITGPEWGDFLCELYDAWDTDGPGAVSVRNFDSILEYLLTGMRPQCTLGNDCRQYLVIEHNGDVYPCDFFVEPELRLGSIDTIDLGTVFDNPRFVAFGCGKAAWNAACSACDVLELCMGDCLKHRVDGMQSAGALSCLCVGWKQFYRHARPKLEVWRNRIASRNRAAAQPLAACGRPDSLVAKPGRNDLCPCGSGLKFKRCCGRG